MVLKHEVFRKSTASWGETVQDQGVRADPVPLQLLPPADFVIKVKRASGSPGVQRVSFGAFVLLNLF